MATLITPRVKDCCYSCCLPSQQIENAVTFLHISLKSHRQPRTWLYLQKANEPSIPTTYWPYRNIILLTFHARVKNISVQKMHHSNQWGKLPETAASSSGSVTASNTRMPQPAPLTILNYSLIVLHTFAQLHNEASIGCNGTLHIHPQDCPSIRRSPLPSNTPVPWPNPLTTPNGICILSVVFPQCTFGMGRQTNRWTDKRDRRQTCYMSAYW